MRYPEIGFAAQIELKYFKATDEVTDATLAKVRADALDQLVRYARDKNIAREWNLKPIPNVTDGVPGGTVELRRLLVVFHGGQVVVCEAGQLLLGLISPWQHFSSKTTNFVHPTPDCAS